jgi:phospholipid-binding lipoprotein MlaA
VLQARPGPALETTGRFVVNTTVGFLGFFDPASAMRLPANTTDFGVTLAHWGVPEGPYLVLPFVGPTTARDVWELPVDSYFDPLGWYARDYSLAWHAEYLPSAIYLITLRANALPLDKLLTSAYDPYVFLRDAYRQHRLYEIYHGNPPLSAMEILQGTNPGAENTDDIEQLLEQQHAYEKTHGADHGATPVPASSAPAHANSVLPPTSAASSGS